MTNTIHAQLNVIERSEPIYANFDAVDTKGRRFGARIVIEVIEFVPAAVDKLCPYILQEDNLGRWYHATPHATRDGNLYGALQTGKMFRTKDEVLAYVAKYFVNAEKRALKNKNRAA